MTRLSVWPCDRGTGTPTALHHFQLSPGQSRAVCIFCGKLGPGPEFDISLDSRTVS